MYAVSLIIFIVPDDIDMEQTDRSGKPLFPVDEYGRTFSTVDEFKPELVNGDYFILYRISDFGKMSMENFVKSMAEVFEQNLGKDTLINVWIDAYGNLTDERFFDQIVNLNKAFDKIDPSNMMVANSIYGDPDDEEDEDSDEDDLTEDEKDFMQFYNSFFPSADKSRSKEKKGSKSKDYSRSRVVANSKHAKRDIKRHNIIIASKKDFKRDADIIEDFLKDFIPGKSDWVKRYRHKILIRWLNAFAIKEKKVKEIQREMKRDNKEKESKRRAKSVGRKTSAIVSKPSYNAFYDPNK